MPSVNRAPSPTTEKNDDRPVGLAQFAGFTAEDGTSIIDIAHDGLRRQRGRGAMSFLGVCLLCKTRGERLERYVKARGS